MHVTRGGEEEELASVSKIHQLEQTPLGRKIQRSSSVMSQVVEQLREAILDGTIVPGTTLRQESVAADLGVSRTPVREAFRWLAAEGLLTLKNTSAEVISLSDDDALEYYELREVVDGLSARLAASRCTPEEYEGLRRVAQELASHARPFRTAKWLTAHVNFHVMLMRMSKNKRLGQFETIVRLSSQMLYPRLNRDQERMLASAHEHMEIAEAVGRGDSELADRLAREHIRSAMKAWLPVKDDVPHSM